MDADANGTAGLIVLEFPVPIILLINLKGGVAKTTTAVALAECHASAGKRTLLIDADHQSMSSELLLGEARLLQAEKRRATLHDLLAAMLDDEFGPGQFPYHVCPTASNIGGGLSQLSVIPGSIRIDDFSTNMAKARRGFRSNDEFLAFFRKRRDMMRRWLNLNYDLVIVDCPPSLAIQVKLFLVVGDAFIIPTIPDRLSVRGAFHLLDRIRALGNSLDSLGTLWSLYRDQNPMHRRIIDETSRGVSRWGELPNPFATVIPNAAAIAEATETGREPRNFNAKYTAQFANMYQSLMQEILNRLPKPQSPIQGSPAVAHSTPR